MSKLKITLTVTVNRDVEEIYARAAVQQAREFMDLVGRGKFQFETTYQEVKRRPSERKPKTKRSLK